MVHEPSNIVKQEEDATSTASDTMENIEDMLEEVEDSSDMQDDDMSYQDEIFENSMDVEDTSNMEEPLAESGTRNARSNLFSCNKCNYVTHIKSRYTKHVKYHSMPMTKCTLCEFRTPYKWNLDRHMKNHGGGRLYSCSMCNFTADIKQSLTVHEMNHHSPAVGQSLASRRRNRVGASDVLTDDASGSLETKEEEGSGDSRSSHSVPDYDSHIPDITDMLNNDSNDMSPKGDDEHLKDSNQGDDKAMGRKKARPIPPLIPLNASAPNQNKTSFEPPHKKMRESINTPTSDIDNNEYTTADIASATSNTIYTKHENAPKKKNESFFDKLKERLLTETGKEGSLTCKDCGFESKCLSEHSVHEKNCTAQSNRLLANAGPSTLGSTRCQNCRHRCKSSADLYIHLQTCAMKNKMETDQITETKIQNNKDGDGIQMDREIGPHPMENVVFVWNNIGQDCNKFDSPLDINIQEDATLPKTQNRSYDPNNVDALHDNEGMNLSPTQAVGKKVYKCPHCPFWASTASRFHVHIVGHLNKKPFECSLCQYKSNWRWDITKHIKLKSARDSIHNEAKVLMTDETGRRNYSKYNKFLAMLKLNENGTNEFQYIDTGTANVDATIELDETINDTYNDSGVQMHMQPLNLQTYSKAGTPENSIEDKKPKKTLWKCKKCNYKDSSKEALIEHVREHSRAMEGNQESLKQIIKRAESSREQSDLAYRCGHCNQLSNWKHVIQRHCRLKHDGVIKVIATEKPKQDQTHISLSELNVNYCPKCPFATSDKKEMINHMQNHMPSSQSIFKCYFCYYFAKTEHELVQHLSIHGVSDPEEFITKGGKELSSDQTCGTKRHKCTECPYETNSRSQFMYHEQFHRLPADTPYKCHECNYSVSKRHLLHQHMKVHGIAVPKKDNDPDEYNSLNYIKDEMPSEQFNEDISYVWVATKNEFHKMYKCRYCSYVNSQRCKIPTHEKIHVTFLENSELVIYKCLECKYTCQSALRLSEHSKSHSEIYGRIYFNVESDVPDEEQIEKLREVIEEEKKLETESSESKDYDSTNGGDEDKTIFFCQKCPARFFSDNELKIHERFHDLVFSFKCKLCEFSVPQETQLTAHSFVHTDEYQDKTKMLKMMHDTHPDYKEPILELVHCPKTSEITWVVPQKNKKRAFDHNPKKISDNKTGPKQYYCKSCPAKFFKNSALSYHRGLHGGEGDHRCKKCDYTVKNVGNLAKHESLHEDKSNCDYESGEDMDYKNIPLSGTDLFQRKTEAQKRVLIDKDKLVKPNDHFPPVLQADPQFGYLIHGNPEFIYPTYMKNGRQKEKRYKCHKCPSAFEKREQYKIHLSLHGSKQRYKCEICDYSVKYYANYVQHMRKHQMNDEAQAERKKDTDLTETPIQSTNKDDSNDNIRLAIKTMPRSVVKSDFQQFSFSDQQTLRLLQRRRSINSALNDSTTPETAITKEKKLHMCVLCPYSNQRQDALANHYKRHDNKDIINTGSHKCCHCDLTVVQSHFLRDHMKLHFNFLRPQCYTANEDVQFTINKIDENDSNVVISLDTVGEAYKSTADRIYVQVATGEITVDQ